MAQRGLEAFDLFYGEMYGERWTQLKASLLLPKKQIEIANPFFVPELQYKNSLMVDATSMMLVQALDPQPKERVIDLCAHLGSSSFLCSLRMQNQGLLLSNDSSAAKRNRITKTFDECIPRTSNTNHKITGFDPSKIHLYEKNIYNKVLLDVPCSNERLALTDEKEMSIWNAGRSKALAFTQLGMLISALDIVKVGGLVVYATSTLSQLENDDNIDKLQMKRGGRFEILPQDFPLGEKTKHGLQFLPDRGDGPTYLTVIKKLK